MSVMEIALKRIYEPVAPADGVRVLVDRLWPRGISKARAGLHLWLRDIAPSADLRRWFDHDPEKWSGFQDKYQLELQANPEAVGKLLALARASRMTLLYAARDQEHNEAVVLRSFLQAALSSNTVPKDGIDAR